MTHITLFTEVTKKKKKRKKKKGAKKKKKGQHSWHQDKHAKLYSDPVQLLNREHLIALGSLQRQGTWITAFTVRPLRVSRKVVNRLCYRAGILFVCPCWLSQTMQWMEAKDRCGTLLSPKLSHAPPYCRCCVLSDF